VAYPQLPDTDNPTLDAWLDIVQAELEMLDEVGDGELIVIAHSLGCLTWLHAVMGDRVPSRPSRVLLVAPADPELCGDVETFQINLDDPILRECVAAVADTTWIIASDADPWIPRGVYPTFSAPLRVDSFVIPGAAHLAVDDGWGPWQGVINWVNDAHADISIR
jgi:predicted alpha/beta hydrolase family esterase